MFALASTATLCYQPSMTDSNDKFKRSFKGPSSFKRGSDVLKRGKKPEGGSRFNKRDDAGFGKPRPGKFGSGDRKGGSWKRDEDMQPRVELTGNILPSEPPEERIAKVIARAGIASRRDAEAMIMEGRVTLNGEVLTSPAINVSLFAKITVDGEPLPERERTRLWLYHKPRGLVTTARDPEGRPTVFEQMPEDMPRVISIGRLDINTEGLLLLTNDGGLARVIAHPDTGWLRRYKVRAHGDITQADLDKLGNGITIDDIEYGPVEARLDRVQGDNVWLTLGLREGKNREVKRILEHIGLSVNRLIRLSFGPFQLGDLESGLVEEIRTKVLKEQLGETLSEQAGVDFSKPVREPVSTHTYRPHSEHDTPDDGMSDSDMERREREMALAVDRREKRRAVWRSEELDDRPLRKGRVPRRGEDPKLARKSLAARPRQRLNAIESGGKTVRVERFVADPSEERKKPSRPSPRYSKEDFASEGNARSPGRRAAPGMRSNTDGDSASGFRRDGARRDGDFDRPRPGKPGFGARPQRPFGGRDDGSEDRPGFRRSAGRDSFSDRPRSGKPGFGARPQRSFGDREEGFQGKPGGRPPAGKRPGTGGDRPPMGAKRPGASGKPFSGKPGFGKPGPRRGPAPGGRKPGGGRER